jgi:hypothetical protein
MIFVDGEDDQCIAWRTGNYNLVASGRDEPEAITRLEQLEREAPTNSSVETEPPADKDLSPGEIQGYIPGLQSGSVES